MAKYPEGNPGEYPFDPSSDVGRFRVLYGDTVSQPYDPPEPGFQDYGHLSDAEIEAYIEQGGGSVLRGIGYYNLALSSHAALHDKTVKDYDLQVTVSRAEKLRLAAADWFKRADEEDAASGSGDIFEYYEPAGGGFVPEGLVPQVGRTYTWDVTF